MAAKIKREADKLCPPPKLFHSSITVLNKTLPYLSSR